MARRRLGKTLPFPNARMVRSKLLARSEFPQGVGALTRKSPIPP